MWKHVELEEEQNNTEVPEREAVTVRAAPPCVSGLTHMSAVAGKRSDSQVCAEEVKKVETEVCVKSETQRKDRQVKQVRNSYKAAKGSRVWIKLIKCDVSVKHVCLVCCQTFDCLEERCEDRGE